MHVSRQKELVASLPALGNSCMVFRTWNTLHSALGNGSIIMFAHLERLHFFSRLALNGYISSRVCNGCVCSHASVLGNGYIFSRAWQWLHMFSRLATVACFSALWTSYVFSVLDTGCMLTKLTCSENSFRTICTRSSNSCLVFFFCFFMVSTKPELGPRFHSNSLSTYEHNFDKRQAKPIMNTTTKWWL